MSKPDEGASRRKIPELSHVLLIGVTGSIIGVVVASLRADYGIILLSAGIALISLVWMQALVGVLSIKRLSVPAAFYWMYFFRVYLPAHQIFLENQGPAAWRYLVGVLGALLLVPLGISLAQAVSRWDRHHIDRFFNSLTWPTLIWLKTSSLWFTGLLLLSTVVVLAHARWLPTMPILQLMRSSGQSEMISALREGSLKTLAIPTWLRYLMAWTRDLFLPLLTMLCWGEFRASSNRKWLWRGLLVLGLGLFYASLTLAKAPVAKFLLMLILYYWLWFKPRLSVGFALFSILVVLLFPFAVNFLKYGMHFTGSDIGTVFGDLWYRLSYITADMPYHYFDLFPLQGKFLGGRTIGLLSGLMGWEYFNTSRYVYDIIVPGGLQSGYANSAFIGDLYADFGMGGVFLGSCVVGVLLQMLQGYLERQSKTTLLQAVYTFVCIAVTDLVNTSVTITLMTGGVVIGVAILWSDRYLGPLLLLRPRSHRQPAMPNGLAGEPGKGKSERQ